MALKPVLHRLLVKPDPVELKTESGIIVQLDKREQKAGVIGTVVAIGNTAFQQLGSTPEAEGVSVGSKIYYAKYSGAETKDGEFIWLNDEDCLGIIISDE